VARAGALIRARGDRLAAVFGFFRRRRRRALAAAPTPVTWAEILTRNAPFAARLSAGERGKLESDMKVLLAEKHFIAAGGMEVGEEVRVTIVAAAARVVLHLDVARYDAVSEIVVYPGAYRHPDKDGAVLGEAHARGVVVLAWDAVVGGLRNERDGHDTATHEFAHVLDARDGSFDGTPELRAHEHYRPWAAVMQAHFTRLRGGDRKLRKVLRDYGTTNEAEFFAVVTEVYFERPAVLRGKAPALYEVVHRFYGAADRAA
jgi:Mlc titration factor MtfA (ptsG expression regulator)